MTSYTREPQKIVARCEVTGCSWHRIYWKADCRNSSMEARGRIAVSTHIRHAHKNVNHKLRKVCLRVNQWQLVLALINDHIDTATDALMHDAVQQLMRIEDEIKRQVKS